MENNSFLTASNSQGQKSDWKSNNSKSIFLLLFLFTKNFKILRVVAQISSVLYLSPKEKF